MEHRLGFVGGGQMARALASAFVSSGQLTADQIRVIDPEENARSEFLQAVDGARSMTEPSDLCADCGQIWLAVKPQVMGVVVGQLRPHVRPNHLIVSIAAGVTMAQLSQGLGSDRVIRVMPNTPCLVRYGACGFSASESVTTAEVGEVETLLNSLGVAFSLPEKLLDAVTGLSGSGPAYVYTMIEALSDGGVRMGLPRDVATQLAVQTVRGSAEMVSITGRHPAVLREQVTSPGGTTIAGLQALENSGYRAAVMAAVQAATLRSQELADSS